MDMLYDVILAGFNADEIMIIDLCMTVCGMDSNAAYKAVDSMPYILAKAVDMKQAKKLKKAFEYEGAFIDVIVTNSNNEDNNINNNSFVPYNSSNQVDNNQTYNSEMPFNSNNQYNNQMDFNNPFSNENIDLYNNQMNANNQSSMYSSNNVQYSEEGFVNPFANQEYYENEENNSVNEDVLIEEDSEEGINLEKIFEENKKMNMIPNDYGDYALEKLEDKNEDTKEEDLFEDLKTDISEFNDCTYKSDDKPFYKTDNTSSKQYISKDDIIKIERERNEKLKQREDTFGISNQRSFNEKTSTNQKQYISKDYIDRDKKQEIIASDDNSFLNLGGTPYDEDCMQLNTEKKMDSPDSSEDEMKKMYDKKALSNMTKSEADKVGNAWLDVLKKTNKNNASSNTNINDFKKEQVSCPKCGSVFVSSKKSQGFFGTGKIKYVCEACRHKF